MGSSINTMSMLSALALVFVVYYCSVEVRAAGESRLDGQIQMIQGEVEKWYRKETDYVRSLKAAVGIASSAHKQSQHTHWPRLMMRVLQVATGVPPSGEVDMLKVNRICYGLKNQVTPIQQEFLANFGEFLRTKFVMDRLKDLSTFLRQIKEMCTPFREEKYLHGSFNFLGAIRGMIVIKNMEKINDDTFNAKVVSTSQSIAPLYSAAMICQNMDSIEAYINDQNQFEMKLVGRGGVGDWPYVKI